MKPVVLTMAGIDPCGGAGIVADLRVAQALGCFGMAAATALTAQDTTGVSQVWPATYEQIVGQGMAVVNDAHPHAIKIGMLGNSEAARAVATVLDAYEGRNIVIDTIIHATSGLALYESDTTHWFMEVMKRARIVTPNLPEAHTILGRTDMTPPDAARTLSQLCGGASIYLKGGHAEGDLLTDTFYNAEQDHITLFTQPRIDTPNTHGTGCTLSTALASFLALGHTLDEAARRANDFMHQALRNAQQYKLGRGNGPAFVE